METIKLVPNLEHPVVECHDLVLEMPTNGDLTIKSGYTTAEGNTRALGKYADISDNIKSYFDHLIYYKIIPLIFGHPNFFRTWPVLPKTVLDNTQVTISVFKDDIGWYQGPHEDPKVFFLSGVVHAQDCDQGTKFIDRWEQITYEAPTKKFSGAFWSNSHGSTHRVDKTVTGRYGWLIAVKWTCLEPFNFSGKNYGAGGSFDIDFNDFYK